MKIDIVTIFPELLEPFKNSGMLLKAGREGLVDIKIHDLRDFSPYKHRQTDDYPFGGGRGMILMLEPLYNAYSNLKKKDTRTVLFSAGGKLLTSARAKRFRRYGHLLLFCGRYEGVDNRFLKFVDDEISIGRYVLFGGEVPAMAFIEAVSRYDPLILDPEVVENETYNLKAKRDYPQYTRPRDFKGMKVPEELLSGNHKKIAEWRADNQEKI